MINMFRPFLFALLLLTTSVQLLADDEVFARQGDVVLTQDEIDAAFARIPEQYRNSFIRDGGKVDQLVQSLLRYKQIAKEAVNQEFDQETLVKARLKLASEKELAEAWMERVLESAPEADYEAIALERYLAYPEEFMTEEKVDVSHILVAVDETRTDEEALDLANRLYAELVGDPSLFESYVKEYSDDPGKVANVGRYGEVRKGQMVEPFEEKAFSMTDEGQLSQPVKTSFGYHIIRLNRKMSPAPIPFEDVKATMVQEARDAALAEFRKNYILGLSAGMIEIPDGAVDAMLRRHFGENLELAPDIYNQ